MALLIWPILSYTQVSLGPLHINHAVHQSALTKTGDTHPYCLNNPYVWITTAAQDLPECGSNNGTITIKIFSSSFPVDISLENGTPISVSTDEYTFTDLASGAYEIEAQNPDGYTTNLFITLNNAGVQAIDINAFVFYPAYCDSGRVVKKFTICQGINCIYHIRNSDDAVMSSFNQQAGSQILAPGNYYLEYSYPLTQCKVFLPFTIAQSPVIQYPFQDDFNRPQILPDPLVWSDKYAYINSSYAINPITIGVATLDGLNEYGMPYVSVSDGFVNGQGDYLTTNQICYDADEEILNNSFLSFFYQPQGYGDYPNQTDTLYCQIKDVRSGPDGIPYGRWKTIWKAVITPTNSEMFDLLEINPLTGDTIHNPYTPDIEFPFKKVFIPVSESFLSGEQNNDTIYLTESSLILTQVPEDWTDEDPYQMVVVEETEASYMRDGMQIRFSTWLTNTGINDQWHIDYVQFNSDAQNEGYDLTDLAHIYPPDDFLTNYSLMPWNHFYNYQEKECDTTLSFYMRNNSDQNVDIDFSLEVEELCTPDEIESLRDLVTQIIGAQDIEYFEYDPNGQTGNLTRNGYFPNDYNQEDGVVIRTSFNAFTDNDNDLSNNTYLQDQIFSNIFAYDDGSAEKSLQLQGTGTKMVMRYVLNEPDELRGIGVSFNQVLGDIPVNDGIMNLRVYKKLKGINGATADEIIRLQQVQYPPASSVVDGYSNYLFEDYNTEPLSVQDTIYVGIEVLSSEEINIGFDRNNSALHHTFISSGEWVPGTNEIPSTGSPMIRAIVGSSHFVGIEDHLDIIQNIILYPNPSLEELNIFLPTNIDMSYYEIIDISGRILTRGSQKSPINISHLPSGFYIMQVYDKDLRLRTNGKFMKI